MNNCKNKLKRRERTCNSTSHSISYAPPPNHIILPRLLLYHPGNMKLPLFLSALCAMAKAAAVSQVSQNAAGGLHENPGNQRRDDAPGIRIPEDIGDGLIMYSKNQKRGDSSGWVLVQPHNSTDDNSPEKRKRSAKIDNRDLPVSSTGCSDFNFIDPSDYITAKARIEAWCDTNAFITGSSAMAYKVGSVAAYVCNFGGSTQCRGDEFEIGMNDINDYCGSQTKTGWVLMNSWAKSYGREILSVIICPSLG